MSADDSDRFGADQAVRAADSERDTTIAVLRACHDEGRLDLIEFDRRSRDA